MKEITPRCDRCRGPEGIYDMDNGNFFCLGCYSGYADHVYEELKDTPSRAKETQ